mmetsp:Transcript_125658/g.305240  ORF Transcript_125658/g.305240 Transcript_125658/m.305240 type:complete len:729 (-) Transcript_125658:68-2254(-)
MKSIRGSTLALLFLLAPLATASRFQAGSPVEKVVNLLKDLKAKIEADGKTEQQGYDKYACWCEKTTKRKADAISAAQDDLRELGQGMLGLKGEIATLASEIAELSENIKANKAAQAEATSIRQKENTAYMAETTEMKEVLNALERAILVLQEGTKPSAFLQQGSAARAALQAVVNALPVSAAVKPEQVSMLSELVGGSAKYAPQSWTVQGILGDMYDTFSADLESATDTEATRNKNYEALIHNKTQQLNAMKTEKAEKEGSKAQAEGLLADKTQSYDDTEAQKQADIAFFDETKSACESKHNEWGTRSELRAEELDGIKKALEILTADDARALFSSAIKAGKETYVDNSYDAGVSIATLLQVSDDASEGAPATHAYAALKTSATATHSLRLAALAIRVREAKVGHFDGVIASIDSMMSTLREEDAADIAKRDQCKSEYQKIASKVADLEWKIRNNEAKIVKIEDMIQQRDAEKTQTIADIQAVEDQMEAMTAQRTSENQDFLSAKREDQAAIQLLDQAKAVLSRYYTQNEIEMGPIQGSVKGLALQQQQPDFEVSQFEAPDATFAGKGSRKGQAKNIVSVLTMLIEDLTDEIRNGMKDEQAAQLQYESAMRVAQQLKADLEAKKLSLEEAIARLTTEKGEEESLKTANEGEHQDEVDYKARITPDCDWILGAFQHRAEHRATEMAGLVKAKEFLAGYQPGQAALLDRSHAAPFDDGALASLKFLGLRQ